MLADAERDGEVCCKKRGNLVFSLGDEAMILAGLAIFCYREGIEDLCCFVLRSLPGKN